MSGPAEPDNHSILLLTELFPPFVGGSALLFENVYSRLEDHRTLVVTDSDLSPGSDEQSELLEVRRVKISHEYWGILRPSAQLHYMRLALQLRRLSRRVSFVHCARTLPEGLVAMICRKLGGPPFACWAHGEDLTMQVNTSREMRFLTDWICRASGGLFANSHFTAGLIEDLGISRDKICVIHPGVEIDRFNPAVDGSGVRNRYAKPGESLLLSVGRLQRRKGFDRVIEAMSRLTEQGISARYLVVGDGPDRGYLEALVERCGLGEKVVLVGKVSDDLLPQYYAACDIFVHPNRIEGVDVEGFGLVFLEAAASGKPAVGGASGGVPEAVLNGTTGYLVGGIDVKELAGVLEELISDPQAAARLGAAGRRRVVEQFTWERVAVRMAHSIRSLESAS